jgi:hypothetical protein
MTQAHTLQWVNPTQNTDGSPFDPADFAGIQIQVDGAVAVSVPSSIETSFDLSTLALWPTLKSGPHTVALAIVNKEGEASAFSAAATFSVARVPAAPTAVVVV